MSENRLPTYFISHGGGPWPWVKDLMPFDFTALEASLAAIPDEVGTTPTAILAASAHWEAPEFTVQTHANPPMLYDYGGFPDFTYQISYPAPGAPEVAEHTAELLNTAGIAARRDPNRGFDHGVFAPLFVSYPEADVPIFQLSLRMGLDPADHLAAGRALAPLREQGVLIIASGFPSFHDLRAFGPQSAPAAKAFDGWLTETLVDSEPDERVERLLDWEQAPAARAAHPREEHFMPVMLAVGAAEEEAGVVQYHEDDHGGWMASSSYRFG